MKNEEIRKRNDKLVAKTLLSYVIRTTEAKSRNVETIFKDKKMSIGQFPCGNCLTLDTQTDGFRQQNSKTQLNRTNKLLLFSTQRLSTYSNIETWQTYKHKKKHPDNQ